MLSVECIALDLSLEQCLHLSTFLRQYLKEKEREAFWRDLSSRPPSISQSDSMQPSLSRTITEDIEKSVEYKTFLSLFHYMKGYAKLKARTRDAIFRPALRAVDHIIAAKSVKKQIVQEIME